MLTPRILALEPWNAGSHRSVVDSINAHGRADWTWLTRPGGGVRWCLRQSALSFAEEVGELHAGGARWDAVLVTSLCSLSDFRACAPPEVRRLPHVLYMHENQAAYPVSPQVDKRTRDRDAHLAFTNLASVEAADRVLFNSEYNRDSFVEAMSNLLSKAPWSIGPGWKERLFRKSRVAWPPVPGDAWEDVALHNPGVPGYADRPNARRRIVRVAWPHRWEHDKGCDELGALIERCKSDPELEFRWVILGRRFTDAPGVMAEIERDHRDVIDRFGGPDDRGEYLAQLRGCDWVTSTARHEFFGIAVVEAIACGCLPWLPDRLSYPELVPQELRGLNPWVEDIDTVSVRAMLRQHLAESRGDRAVERIEQELSDAITAGALSRKPLEDPI